MPQKHLKGLRNKWTFLGPMSVSDSVGLGRDHRIYRSRKFLGDASVAAQGDLTLKIPLNHSDKHIKVT